MNPEETKRDQNGKSSDDREMQLVTFKLQKEEFAVEIDKVREILKLPEIVPIPKTPDFFEGITNLRGYILPVVNSARRLKFPEQELTPDHEILVLSHLDNLTGIVVDQVEEVISVRESAVSEPSQVIRGIDKFFLKGVVRLDNGKRIILLLNLDEFLNVELRKQAASTLKQDSGSVFKESVAKKFEQLVTFSWARKSLVSRSMSFVRF